MDHTQTNCFFRFPSATYCPQLLAAPKSSAKLVVEGQPHLGLPYSFLKAFTMRSKKQIAASRENGRKSHGATTPEGKSRIVTANLSTGVYSNSHTLP